MTSVLVPLAQGCEELEAVTVTDLLTRAGIDVVTAGLDGEPVVAARGLKIIPQTIVDNVVDKLFDMVAVQKGWMMKLSIR